MSTLTELPDGGAIQTIVHPSGNRSVRVVYTDEGFLRDPPEPVPHRDGAQFYVPYTRVHPATVAGAPKDTIWIDVSSGPFAYYGALHTCWERGEDFAILEHDVVCRPDVVEAFESCPEPWCVFGYADICCQDETGWSPCMEAWRNEIGCTRFRKELIELVPDALSGAPLSNNGNPIKLGWDWHNLCDGLGNNLRFTAMDPPTGEHVARINPKTGKPITHHWHFPPVEHHHMAQP